MIKKKQWLARSDVSRRPLFPFCLLNLNSGKGCLDSWVLSHKDLNIVMLCYAMGDKFLPWWWQTLYHTQAQYLDFFMIWFDTVICLSNLSCELGIRKFKINKHYFEIQILVLKKLSWFQLLYSNGKFRRPICFTIVNGDCRFALIAKLSRG